MNCIGLVGNPNSGKSTLFNALTGSMQKVGNWSGVTVDCKSGISQIRETSVSIVDLPGIYQLSISDNEQGIDAQIARDFITSHQADFIINVIDAAHLERHLYLTLQLLSINLPMVVAVNMLDTAERQGIEVDLNKLQQELNCPVVGLVASKGRGISALKEAVFIESERFTVRQSAPYPASINEAVVTLAAEIKMDLPKYEFCSSWLAQQLLEHESVAERWISTGLSPKVLELQEKLNAKFREDLDIVFADALYTSAHQIMDKAFLQKEADKTLTERLDKVVLNRYLGVPVFLGVMYLLFLFAIKLGGAFQDFFDITSSAIFVNGTAQFLQYFQLPSWIVAIFAAGFGRGINTTITFIPVIGCMFFFLAFLESSGYMARAIFVIDRFMRIIGLPGKSFVPMIIGFGCNVPAILAARNLEHKRDRYLTILMSPFMSCGARLAIFAIFTSAFFPVGGQNIVFMLYFIGILAAILTGLILRKTLLKGDLSPLVLEFPAYHFPTLKTLLAQTWHRLKSFLVSAGKLIIPLCLLIGFLNSVNIDGSFNQKDGNSHSLLSAVGRTMTPILAPMGVREDNWPATVGLLTGVLAKEVVIATLNTLYSQEANLSDEQTAPFQLKTELKSAFTSVPNNLAALWMVSDSPQTINREVYGIMHERFSSQSAAFAYLLFVLLYFPCISATSAMAKELDKQWALFSVAWSTFLAYGVATLFYQVATFSLHPKNSLLWIGEAVICFSAILYLMRKIGFAKNSLTNRVSAL